MMRTVTLFVLLLTALGCAPRYTEINPSIKEPALVPVDKALAMCEEQAWGTTKYMVRLYGWDKRVTDRSDEYIKMCMSWKGYRPVTPDDRVAK